MARVLTLLLLALGVGGCEQLANLMGGKEPPPGPSAASSTTATTNPAMPTKPSVAPTDVVATANGAPIATQDVRLRVEELKGLVASVGQAWQPLTAEQLDAVVRELINTELMSQDAAARGVDRHADVQRRWEYTRRGFFAQEWVRWNRDRLTVSDADVTQYYEQNKLGFRDPERRKLRQLTVGSEDQAKQALARLLGEGMELAALAQQISLAPSAPNGGLLGAWVMRTNDAALFFPSQAEAEGAGVMTLDPALEAAAFAIDREGGLSNYVTGADNQYHIFQLVERQPERQRPLEELREGIRNALLAQRLQEAVDGLNTKAKVERFNDRLSGLGQ